jgi:ring-1,2-phenylacetyl-CoA epoxidase subunit PaaA
MPTATSAGHRCYELWDPMPDEVREGARRFATVQALNEMVGVLQYVEWLDRTPSHTRRQMLMAKIQDEVGHGHVVARVAEDLGMPRERILVDYLEGRTKLHNIFHYSFATWEELGPGLLLTNSAAIMQFQSLAKGVYLPYSRALRKVEREESFHYQHALDLTHEILTHGDAEQRRRVQDGFELWLPRILAYLGPPDTDTLPDNPMWQIGMKPDGNDAVRQAWLTKIIPVFRKLGVHVDPALVHQTPSGEWQFAMPDWAATKKVIANGGPSSQRRLDWVRRVLDRNARYRRALKGVA